ncbi:copper amine oxidase N-terminal domain-containing protein [Paenibacillus sp. SC116]|uniref:copper amine oxidase N-terminal domain-containing protein n=1 Tax=Paenibacillus sp. SC116 TaxID=2968986 RepID=UPI00215B231E|nr:copper amine oxidase N-terminal domain-containing protein [Paenibacillus sp. SC116]MCR8843268.1 copper amine oxidase N-terminal domain-containing protein [Paenibacillus sp. SC116]
MKKTTLVTFTLVIALSLNLVPPVQAATTVDNHTVNVVNAHGESILSGAIMHEGASYILASQLHEVMDVELSWESTSHSVTIKGGQNQVNWYSISDKLKVNGKDVTLTEKPIIKNKRTYVPISLLKKVFRLPVSWDQPSKTAIFLDGSSADDS